MADYYERERRKRGGYFPAVNVGYGTPLYNAREYDKIMLGQAQAQLRAQGFTAKEISDAKQNINKRGSARYGGLYPPGAGTYYNADRYVGAPIDVKLASYANLTRAWQRDLEFNRVANPTVYSGEQANRIGAQYGGSSFGGNRPGYQTVYTPGGGSILMSDAQAKRRTASGGYSLTPPELAQSNINNAYARGYGAPTPTVQAGYLAQGGVANPVENLSPQQRIQYGAGTGLDYLRSNPALAAAGTLAYNALQSVGNLFRPKQQSVQSQNYYAYNPSPVPPRRYFDF